MEFRKARWTTRLKRLALSVDAWIGASLYAAGQRAGEVYERIRSATDRLTVSGPKRLAAEFASEGLNVGIAGAIVMLMLAIPAFGKDAKRRSRTRSSPSPSSTATARRSAIAAHAMTIR